MTKKEPRRLSGFTLVELMITTVIMVIVGLAIGVVIVDGQTGWNVMYDRINSDIMSDGYAARRKFDSVVRSASSGQIVLAGDGSWIEVYAYESSASPVVDRYWRFYVSDGDLIAEYGQLDPKSTLNVETVCGNVSGCTFKQFGRAIQMTLELDNGQRRSTVVSSAV
ncbi:MAG: prepilin-type N-terminal cleavage/methylation domain-containing protein, partial [Phycisphaerales bacterium]